MVYSGTSNTAAINGFAIRICGYLPVSACKRGDCQYRRPVDHVRVILSRIRKFRKQLASKILTFSLELQLRYQPSRPSSSVVELRNGLFSVAFLTHTCRCVPICLGFTHIFGFITLMDAVLGP